MQDVEFLEKGSGPKVVLFHSSASGAGQWKVLMDHFKEKFHFISVNLIGYGKTTAWTQDKVQTLLDQVKLLEKIPSLSGSRFSIVGHSFGGSVAMKAAKHYRDRLEKLVLVEPNPFYLLGQEKRTEAFAEVLVLRNKIKNEFNKDWEKAVSFFADYWNGRGTWRNLSEIQKERFSIILKPNYYEWDAVFSEETSLETWKKLLPINTTLIGAANTVRTIRELNDLFRLNCPNWNFKNYSGGHMAPITSPKLVNPLIINGLV